MVYHYRTVKCPRCGKTIGRTITTNSEILKGSPFRVCPKCKKTYFDSEYKEMGLVYFEDKGGKISFWGALCALIVNVAAIFILCSGIFGGGSVEWLLLLCLIGFIAIITDVGIVNIINNHKNFEAYHQKQVDYIEGRTKEQAQSVVESMNRLSNKAYLDALRIHGVNVPEYFYERLGEIPTDLSTIVVETVSPAEKFICENCGKTSSGWYQTCPNCGAVGKMKKNMGRENEEPANIPASNAQKATVNAAEKFICEACGKTSPGWYQTCSNCGAVGRMKKNMGREAEKPANIPALNAEKATVNAAEKFICEACGKTSPGWYQTCPNCGAVGKMKKNT